MRLAWHTESEFAVITRCQCLKLYCAMGSRMVHKLQLQLYTRHSPPKIESAPYCCCKRIVEHTAKVSVRLGITYLTSIFPSFLSPSWFALTRLPCILHTHTHIGGTSTCCATNDTVISPRGVRNAVAAAHYATHTESYRDAPMSSLSVL